MTPSGPIVVLTGAGISAESGIRTFRGADGLWENHRIEDVASPEGYRRNPDLVHRFYNERRRQLLSSGIEPNEAHRAVARLEEKWPEGALVITQNVDDLHERAGSRNILHMHGRLLEVRCEACGRTCDWQDDLFRSTACHGCKKDETLRPNIVWFGEMPIGLDRIFAALERSALFISIGTSGNVYPAAGFVEQVRMQGNAHTVELNLKPSAVQSMFAERIYGPATQTVPAYVSSLLSGSRN